MSYITPPTSTTLKTATTPSVAAQPAQNTASDIRNNPQQIQGWTGIKFPFRFSNTGRVATSTTSATDVSHIKEAIEQICLTRFRERFFNATFGSFLLNALFENIPDIQQVFETSLLNSLQTQEKRVTFSNLTVVGDNNTGSVYLTMTYTINQLFSGTTVQQTISVVG